MANVSAIACLCLSCLLRRRHSSTSGFCTILFIFAIRQCTTTITATIVAINVCAQLSNNSNTDSNAFAIVSEYVSEQNNKKLKMNSAHCAQPVLAGVRCTIKAGKCSVLYALCVDERGELEIVI